MWLLEFAVLANWRLDVLSPETLTEVKLILKLYNKHKNKKLNSQELQELYERLRLCEKLIIFQKKLSMKLDRKKVNTQLTYLR